MNVSQYIEIFIQEAKDHVENLSQNLLQLEKNPSDTVIINEIFRSAHTIKGMAGTMGFTKMTNLTHHMEDVLSEIRNNTIQITSEMIDVLFKCLDSLEVFLNSIISTGAEGDSICDDIIEVLSRISQEKNNYVSKSPKKDVLPEPVVVEKEKEETDKGQIIELNVYEQEVINKAAKLNTNAYKAHIRLNKGCLLKAARTFIIFDTLRQYLKYKG